MTPNDPPAGGRRANIKDYLKAAFLYRWNVLLFGGAVAAAMLTPWPDAILPLVGAAEAVYLTGMVSSDKFRRATDASVYHEERKPQIAQNQRALQDTIYALPVGSRERFQRLRDRCIEMRAIATGVRGGQLSSDPGADSSTAALDRLLWAFLRLLVSQEALTKFLRTTRKDEITARLEEAQARLKDAQGNERLVRSLEDSVAVQQGRLENYNKAASNAEFVRVELDRIEAKIHALTEASVNRQDTGYLSTQIDSVAETMEATEKALSEMQQITGIVEEMNEPPAILQAEIGGGGGRR
ncbi:MAG: hypothetical protein R2729_16745 [Bryobacteraceae bacterium]